MVKSSTRSAGWVSNCWRNKNLQRKGTCKQKKMCRNGNPRHKRVSGEDEVEQGFGEQIVGSKAEDWQRQGL